MSRRLRCPNCGERSDLQYQQSGGFLCQNCGTRFSYGYEPLFHTKIDDPLEDEEEGLSEMD